MSHAAKWIVVGTSLLVLSLLFGVGGATDDTDWLIFAVPLGLAGLFTLQVGVMALAVRIGTQELLEALAYGDHRSRQSPSRGSRAGSERERRQRGGGRGRRLLRPGQF